MVGLLPAKNNAAVDGAPTASAALDLPAIKAPADVQLDPLYANDCEVEKRRTSIN